MTDFSAVREMTPYLSDPPAMAVGTPGKSGYLRLGFELDASGRSILRDWERRAPLYAAFADVTVDNSGPLEETLDNIEKELTRR